MPKLEQTESRPAAAAMTRYEAIDLLRGFAAVSVVIYHVIELWEWKEFPMAGPLLWFRIGWMGVDLFFVISGFVIGLSAFAEIDRHGPSRFRWPFMRRRLARIVPLHYLTLLMFCVFISPELMFVHGFWKNLLIHLAFAHNFFIQWQGSINGPNWSLATEMQFYLLMALTAPWLRAARCWQVGLVLVSIAWGWRFGVTQVVPRLYGTADVFPLFVASTQLPGMLDEFAAGILLARLMRSGFGAWLMPRLMTHSGRAGIVLLAGCAVYAALSVYWPHANYWDMPWMVTFFRTALGASFALVLLATCTLNLSGILKKLFFPLLYLGTVSYGIYLWHLPVLNSLKRVSWLTPQQVLPLALVLTLILASVSWHFFERPFMQRHRTR